MGLLDRLGSREVLVPHLEQSMLAENWPDHYTVTVDTSPYYGQRTPEGDYLEIGSGDGRFHPSSALDCQRSLFIAFHPKLQHLRPVMRKDLSFYMTVNYGTAIHSLMQTQLTMCGLIVPGSIEWEYDCPEHNLRGRIDAVVETPTAPPTVLDIKTINSRGFGLLQSHTPKESWEAQVNLGMDHYGVDRGMILAVEAGYPWGLKEVTVKRNDELLDSLYSKWERVLEAIQRDTPLDCLCQKGCWAGQIPNSELVSA